MRVAASVRARDVLSDTRRSSNWCAHLPESAPGSVSSPVIRCFSGAEAFGILQAGLGAEEPLTVRRLRSQPDGRPSTSWQSVLAEAERL